MEVKFCDRCGEPLNDPAGLRPHFLKFSHHECNGRGKDYSIEVCKKCANSIKKVTEHFFSDLPQLVPFRMAGAPEKRE